MLNPFEKSNISWLIILLPGFLSLQVFNYFSVVSDNKHEIFYVASALSFSLFNIIFLIIFLRILNHISLWVKDDFSMVSPAGLVLLVNISVLTGWIWSWIDSSNWLYKSFSPSTRVISGMGPFATTLERNEHDVKSIVVVTLKNGKSYWGWPFYYSTGIESADDIVLYLEPAGLLKNQTCLLSYSVAKVKECTKQSLKGLLVFKDNIQSISFLNDTPPNKMLK